MSNEEESLLALLCESLSNGQRGNAPIFINFNSFNGPVGQHNDHADTVNFSMDKDGTISFQHIRRTGKSIIQPEVTLVGSNRVIAGFVLEHAVFPDAVGPAMTRTFFRLNQSLFEFRFFHKLSPRSFDSVTLRSG